LAAVPSIGRATRVERPTTPGAAAAGDLYERYSAQIFGYCLHQLGSREEAEDAVQTTFMNAFRGLSRGIVPELESAWLFKIAHNVCLSRRRSSWRRGRIEAPNNFEALQEIVPGREQVADELIRLQDALEEMPENQRRAILLREWQGLTYREISGELGLSQAAVETLIFRARRALAQGLEQDAGSSAWKKRLRQGADVGAGVACIKMLLGGGGAAAMKVAATAIAIATAAVAAASTPAPERAHAASFAPKPAAMLSTQSTSPTRSLASSGAASTAAGDASGRPRSPERRPSRPIAPAPSASAPAPAPADTASAPPETTSAPAAPTPAAAPPPADAEPTPTPDPSRGNGKGKGKGKQKDKSDRRTQSTPPPATGPTPPPEPAEPAPAAPQAEATPPAQESRTDKADKPDRGHGNGKK
jgi:RNA polymerase sigma factor (sigma-70 family)